MVFGYPEISNEEPLLNGRSLEFEGYSSYEQVQLNLDPSSPSLTIEFDIVTRNLLTSDYAFSIILDTPEVRTLSFHGDLGSIYVFRPFMGSDTLQSFQDGRRYHVQMAVDRGANLWTVSIDGIRAFRGTINATSIGSMRFSLSPSKGGAGSQANTKVYLDNLVISNSSGPITAGTQLVRKGEFRVHSTRDYDQGVPSTAMNDAGEAVVVWQSVEPSKSPVLYGQRYDATGAALGGEFRINTTTSGERYNPQVAVQPDGGFLVVWSAQQPSSAGFDIYGRLFASNGQPLGDEFQVNGANMDHQRTPSVAVDAQGDFTVVWNSRGGSANGIFGRRFDRTGVAVGSEFDVIGLPAKYGEDPSVATDPTGNFVVTWSSFDGFGYDIFAQRFNSAALAQGNRWVVNSSAMRVLRKNPKAAMDPSGSLVVVWDSSQDGPGRVYARRFAPSGAALEPEFRVDSLTVNQTKYPSVAVSPDGSYVVVWSSYSQDGSDWAVQGQRFTAAGARDGGEFQVNTEKSFEQFTSSGRTVATDAAGNFLVVWQGGQDISGTGIYADKFFLITKPTVSTLLAANVTATSATLRAHVNPQGRPATVRFEYGTTRSYGSFTPWMNAGDGFVPAILSGGLSNLKPHTTYYFRAIANNEEGLSYGESSTFDTGNQAPIANRDSYHTPTAATAFTLDVLTNDSEPDGDVLTLTVPQIGEQGYNPAVSVMDRKVVYTPQDGFNGNDNFTYHLRDDFGGRASATVTLANLPVVPLDQDVRTGIESEETFSLSIHQLASDGDGDPLSIIGVSPAATGEVEFSSGALIYRAAANYPGEDAFSCTVSDHRGSVASVLIKVRAAYAKVRAVTARGALIPVEAGVGGDMKWWSFGAPSIFSEGTQIGFLAKLKKSGNVLQGVFMGSMQSPVKRVRTGDLVPDESGRESPNVRFKRFFDPVFNGGSFAVIAGIKGLGVTAQNDTGLWLYDEGQLRQIVRENALAPGTVDGRFDALHSILMPDSNRVFFTARLRAITGGPTLTRGGFGLWGWSRERGVFSVLRRDEVLEVGGVLRRVRSFHALAPVKTSGGHPRYDSGVLTIHARLRFYDGADAIVAVDAEGQIRVVEVTGTPAEDGTVALRFGVPSSPGHGRLPVSLVTLQPSGRRAASYKAVVDHQTGTSLAKEGDVASGSSSEAFFGSFEDPVAGTGPDGESLVAFVASLKGGEKSNNSGLWLWSEMTSDLRLVAQKGDSAPGIQGATFRAFNELSVLEGYGLVFTATYYEGAESKTKLKRRGCWALSPSGVLRLLFHEGQVVESSSIEKFQLFEAVPKSFGQGRAWAHGDVSPTLVYRAYLTNGKDVILSTSVPE